MKKSTKKEVKKVTVTDKIAVSNIFNYSDDCTFFNLHIDAEDVGEITIYSCKVISTKKGDMISFPSRKGDDDKYYSHVFLPLSDDLKNKIIDVIGENI